MIQLKKIAVSRCLSGIYLRWWYNGWHYFNFTNGYDINMVTENMDIMTSQMFSRIAKIERPTKIGTDYSYKITVEGITEGNIAGFQGLLIAEKVEQYEGTILPGGTTYTYKWYEVDITRGNHVIKEEGTNGYILDFEITRKELPYTPSVFQRSLRLYLIDDNVIPAVLTECDLNTDEVIPINKQTNDIAEMQDRQSDFTAQFKIRKTRAMMALFELSGEVGANTWFPYQKQTCRLIQDNIEMITAGSIILDRVDDSYYYVSIYSGNLDFFKVIANKKLTDLVPASPDTLSHTWDLATIEGSHLSDLDYVYPLCEPSQDGSIAPLNPGVETVNMFGGWIWSFVKVKKLWDDIFINAGFYPEGNILTNDTFLKLFMPIQSLSCTNTSKYLYSAWWGGTRIAVLNEVLGFPGVVLVNGNANFQLGYYDCPFTAVYKLRVTVIVLGAAPTLSLYNHGAYVGNLTVVSSSPVSTAYEITYNGTAGDQLSILTTANTYYYYDFNIIEITDAKIAFSSFVNLLDYLPTLTQTEFIKMILNIFGLIPEVTSKDRTIKFWNYLELYDNMLQSRDWTTYLSERDDETEFKFGDYAQNNYLRFKESTDVIKNNGMGTMKIEDETLPFDKEVVMLPVSYSDEIKLDPMMAGVVTSRIPFNIYNPDTDAYDSAESIETRIVYVDILADTSPPIKTFVVRDEVTFPGAGSVSIANPKIAQSLPVSFSYNVINYAGLSRMLTKTNLRRAKFNLPVYEVAGFKHYIPIYLDQYKAYFYVNKINNYVPGKLCIIDLIKL